MYILYILILDVKCVSWCHLPMFCCGDVSRPIAFFRAFKVAFFTIKMKDVF